MSKSEEIFMKYMENIEAILEITYDFDNWDNCGGHIP